MGIWIELGIFLVAIASGSFATSKRRRLNGALGKVSKRLKQPANVSVRPTHP